MIAIVATLRRSHGVTLASMGALAWMMLFIAVGTPALVRLFNLATARRSTRSLRAAQPCTISQLAEGDLGCVVGKVRIDQARLTAPFSGRPCVCYLAEVAENITSDSITGWTTVIFEQRCVAFVLEDPTGRALIDATGAELVLELTVTTASLYDHPYDRRAAFVERHREARTEISAKATRLRYREAIIAEDDMVAVSGSALREPDPEAASAPYRGDQPTRLRVASTARQRLVIGSGNALLRGRRGDAS